MYNKLLKIYSKLLGEETSGNHQAYRRGHLYITILNKIRAATVSAAAGKSKPKTLRLAPVWGNQDQAPFFSSPYTPLGSLFTGYLTDCKTVLLGRD